MGAPKGNTNALKHGLYAKHFSEEDRVWLRVMAPGDLRHEMYMIRLATNGVFKIQQRILARLASEPGSSNSEDEAALARMTNSLALALTALNTTARTYALFSGTDTTLNDPLDEALGKLDVFQKDRWLEDRQEDGEVMVEKT